ncbi:hypothetical protein IFR05_010369 [Cadophora sp. M221]|nr:hypothetical protein IFR05_010369 [Cadophora sp. M221]
MLTIQECDEQSPQCSPCTKHRVACSFNEKELFHPLESQIATPIPPNQLLDLQFLHNFTTSTFDTLSDRKEANELFRTAVVEESFKYDFLIHVILCVSGLHLARFSNNPQTTRLYSECAIAHYNTAIQSFRKILVEDITSVNCHAVFACSGLIFVASCAQPRLEPDCSRVLGWFILLRGVSNIVNPCMEWVSSGPFAGIVSPELARAESGAEVRTDFDSHFESLSDYLSQSCTLSEFKILDETLSMLRNTFVGRPAVEGQSLFWWPAMISPEYMSLLSAGNPESLVVLAYYCVLIYKKGSKWWLEGWSEFILTVVDRELNGRMSHWMKWPMETVGLPYARDPHSGSTTDGSPESIYVGSEHSGASPF